jgi:hypothetical protein
MIGQLLAHLWGDYLLQSDWMALNKRKESWPCAIHATIYSLCFLPLIWPRHWVALGLIAWTHYLIDRYGLARYVVYAKNFMAPKSSHYTDICLGRPMEFECRYYPWEQCSDTGYDKNRPAWLTVWLLIVADNTLHLTCNYIALKHF